MDGGSGVMAGWMDGWIDPSQVESKGFLRAREQCMVLVGHEKEKREGERMERKEW